jgi:hypothetical protein
MWPESCRRMGLVFEVLGFRHLAHVAIVVWAHVLVLDEHADGGAECHALFGSCTVPPPLGFRLSGS